MRISFLKALLKSEELLAAAPPRSDRSLAKDSGDGVTFGGIIEEYIPWCFSALVLSLDLVYLWFYHLSFLCWGILLFFLTSEHPTI